MNKVVSMTRQHQSISEAKTGKLHVFIFAQHLPSINRKYVHEVLVNCLFKLAQEKVWLGELTAPP